MELPQLHLTPAVGAAGSGRSARTTAKKTTPRTGTGAGSGISGGGPSTSGTKKSKASSRAKRNRAMAMASNAKRKGQIKNMEEGVERTRRDVAVLEEAVRQLEKENRDLRRVLGSHH